MNRFLFFIFLLPSVESYLIQINPLFTQTIKICANCRESFLDNKEYKCRLFYQFNIINGEAFYSTCKTARMDEEKCGLRALHFFPNSSFGTIEN